MTIPQILALYTINEGSDKYDGFYYRGRRLLEGTVKTNKIKRGGIVNVGKRLRGGNSYSSIFIQLPFAMKNQLSTVLLQIELTD
jgi:hypothetical protein